MWEIRRANKNDIGRIIELLHQVDMVHHVIRPDLFKPNTTKYNEQELEALFEDDNKPVFVFDNGKDVLGHAFCLITEVRDDKLLQDIKTLYIDDICVACDSLSLLGVHRAMSERLSNFQQWEE